MYICEFCGKNFKAKRGLKNHIDKFHSDKISYDFKCEICNKGFNDLSRLLAHISKCHKGVSSQEYYDKYLFGKIRCKYCNELLPYERFSGEFCNQQHYESYNRKDKIKYICEICKTGFEDKGGLQQHLGKKHKEVNQEEYYKQYLMNEDEPDGKCLWCGKDVRFSSFTDGYNKFCYNNECNIRWYNQNTNRKEEASKSLSETYKNDKSLLPQNKEYWIKKGFTEEEAKVKVIERQRTFTKEKCIEKYGEERGLNKWQERQEKWLKSFPKQNYSIVSQELFWKIYGNIYKNFQNIYFATNDNGVEIKDKNKEFKIKTNKSVRSLDFYIPEIKKCIEFDGTYWHGEVGRGNRTRDEERDKEIKSSIQGIQILHIKERDYRSNPNNIIQECLEFING